MDRSCVQRGGKWIAVKILEDPVRALAQSYLRTKTTDYASFRAIQEMRTDTSNNTVYADGEGSIAYFHGNFIPRRDPRYDFTRPVDGSDPATEWRGPHRLDETITLLNPANGWIQNTNNWPFSAAGAESPKRESYPAYMWTRGENPRGIHAVELLENIHNVTLDSLIATAYDAHLTAFEVLLPPLAQRLRSAECAGPAADEFARPDRQPAPLESKDRRRTRRPPPSPFFGDNSSSIARKTRRAMQGCRCMTTWWSVSPMRSAWTR